jgi:hypothetical protein
MSKKRNDLSGSVFGVVTVIKYLNNDCAGHSTWECLCSCGERFITKGYRLIAGEVQSCGCIKVNGKSNGITPAKKMCPYNCCPHNTQFQDFDTDAEPIVNDWVRENGACMLEITEEEQREGVAGMRRGATLQEIADHYQVCYNAVYEVEQSALSKSKKLFKLSQRDLGFNPFQDY